MKRTRRERNKQNEKQDQFPLLPFASHRILSGNYGHIVYTPGPFACQSRTTHSFGHNSSFQLIKGKHQAGLVGLEPQLVLSFVGPLSVRVCVSLRRLRGKNLILLRALPSSGWPNRGGALQRLQSLPAGRRAIEHGVDWLGRHRRTPSAMQRVIHADDGGPAATEKLVGLI